MPTRVIPLAGNPTRRPYIIGTAQAIDQRYAGCFFEEAPSPLTQQKPIWVTKRAGFSSLATPAAGQSGTAIYYSQSLVMSFGAFGGSNSTIFRTDSAGTTTSFGAITGTVSHFSETSVSDVIHILITSSDQTGWYCASDAADTTAYTADGNNSTTITDIKVLGVPSVSGLYVGQRLTAASNIVAGSRIASIDPVAFSAVLTIATTGGAFNDLAITKTPVAKIIDAEFPTDIIGQFASMNGYNYIMDDDGNIYGSDLNSISSWSPDSIALANSYTDTGRGVIRYRNMIAAFGSNSVEFFIHSSNATFGSPLMRLQDSISNIGARKGNSSLVMYADGHGSIFFIGEDYNFYTLDGASAKKLNESPFTTTVGFAGLTAFSTARKRFINFVASAAAGGQWYDVDTGMFTYPVTASQHYVVGPDTSGSCYAVSDGAEGKFYTLRPDQQATFQDNGVAYTMELQTEPIVFNGGRGFTVNVVRLISDNQSTTGTATLSTYRDDYAAAVAKGTFNMNVTKKEIRRVGFYKSSCAFLLKHSDNDRFRAQALEVDWEPGVI